MKLKKLELYGFKSFAQRTEIVFDEGITGIVGPNGSGKSNIGDAVRWVLGEQSAKTLRGASMSDVIFNGTQKRKPLSYCEVSLVFDNDDHALAMEAAEVMVTQWRIRILLKPHRLPLEGRGRPLPRYGHRQRGILCHWAGAH